MKTENKNKPQGSSLLIIGSGRLATHLTQYFELLRLPHTVWDRSVSFETLQKDLKNRPTVLLAISDKAIEPFYREHLQGQRVVHFSGALHVPEMISCHPLMTFGPFVYDLATYKKIHFAVTGAESLQDAIPGLPNSFFKLSAENKPLYHALCVLSAAGAQKLWSESQALLSEMGVSEGAMAPYISQVTENYLLSGRHALTGPWVRQDEQTIAKNLSALKVKSDSLYQVYKTLKEGDHDNS